jgi:hypothetical protein
MAMGCKLVCMWLGLMLAFPSPSDECGYRRITMKERLKNFYRTGGKEYLNKKVHIHIPAAVFRKKPTVIVRPDGKIWHLYANQSVPVLVSPRNSYYKRLQKALAESKKKKTKKKIQTVSLFGQVVAPTWDVKGRCQILFFKMKTYGGALTKTGG